MRWERVLEMFDLSKLNEAFSACGCGRKHECLIKDIRIGEKLVGRVGAILKENGFPEKLLLVADENTLSAARGILESLQGFDLVLQVYRDFRIPRIEEVERISERISEVEGVLVVGTGSLTDVCRLACHRKGRPLAVFATAPSMDGFASNSSPIIFSGFKRSVPAKAPDVVIADAKVLAASPWRLQAAGFGDMIGKYVALVDWETARLVTGEYYCPKIADFVRSAADDVLSLASEKVGDKEKALRLFEGLLKTGIAMGYAGCSRPASGAEHMLVHFWECWELASGRIPDFHGAYVGVATLLVLEQYREFLKKGEGLIAGGSIDADGISALAGPLGGEIRKMFETDDSVIPFEKINWPEIRRIILSVPSPTELKEALLNVGAPTSVSEVGVGGDLKRRSWICHPFFRNRFTLMRLFFQNLLK